MGDLREALLKAGLKFAPPDGTYDLAALGGKTCFSQYLGRPNVHNVPELFERAKAMHPTVKLPAGYRLPSGEWRASANQMALVNEVTGAPFAFVSSEYNLVNDADLVMEAAEAVRDRGLTPVGHVSQGSGRLRATFIMADPEYVIPLLKDHSRTIMSGFSFTNSYTADLGIHAQAAGIDTVCVNYNLWGKVVAEAHMTHLKAGNLALEVRRILDAALGAAPKVQALYNAAHEIRLLPKQVSPLLAGVGFSETATEYVDRMRERLEPLTATRLTLLTLNMASTAFATHVVGTGAEGADVGAVRAASEKALRLLTERDNLDRLEKRGRERMKEWALQRAKAAQVKADKATAAPKAN